MHRETTAAHRSSNIDTHARGPWLAPPHDTEIAAAGIVIHGETHPGTVRLHNDDHFLAAELSRGFSVERSSLPLPIGWNVGRTDAQLLVVADGVSGRADGDLASALVVQTIAAGLSAESPSTALGDRDRLAVDLQRSLTRVQDHLRLTARNAGDHVTPPATTLTAAYVHWPDMLLVHVGHSRCYLWRDGTIQQLTRDHTLAARLLASGIHAEPDGNAHKVLLQAIGGQTARLDIDVECHLLAAGDRVLLCTDGLYDCLCDDEMSEIIAAAYSPREGVERLIDTALANDAEDNVTALLMYAPS